MGPGSFLIHNALVFISLTVGLECQADLLFKGRLPYVSQVSTSEKYPQEVAIYGKRGPRAGYDLILHLHGFRMKRDHLNGRLETFNDVLDEFQFGSLLTETGRNALVIVPSSLGKCDTYATHLIPERRFQLFFEALIKTIGAYPNRIVLVGHSGSYEALAAILKSPYQAFISELYLLDATYGEEEAFAEFARQPGHRMVSIFRKDSSTEEGSYAIWSLLHPELQSKATREAFYQSLLPESSSSEMIPKRGASFIASNLDHWRIVNEFWARLLAFTGSEPIPE